MSKSKDLVKAAQNAYASSKPHSSGVAKGEWRKAGEVVSKGAEYYGVVACSHVGEFKSLETAMQCSEEYVRLHCHWFVGWSLMWTRPLGDGVWKLYAIKL